MSYLRGKEYEAEKKKITNETGVNQHSEVAAHFEPQAKGAHDTAERIGKEHGVGQATVRRDARFAKAVDTISGTAPELKQKILSGKINAPKKQIVEIAEKPEPERKAIVKQLETRDDVVQWIILNQFGRRNLSPGNRSLLALRLEPIYKEKAKANQQEHGGMAPGRTLPQKSAEVKPIETRKEVAKLAGVSHETIGKKYF